MSNNKQSSVVETAIKQIYQRILDSKNPNTLTKRSGEYRIGLQEAINILEDLKAMHKKEIMYAYMKTLPIEDGVFTAIRKAEQHYNETYGGNNDQR